MAKQHIAGNIRYQTFLDNQDVENNVRQLIQLMSTVGSTTEQVFLKSRTASERWSASMAHAKNLLQQGKISAETFGRAVQQADANLQKMDPNLSLLRSEFDKSKTRVDQLNDRIRAIKAAFQEARRQHLPVDTKEAVQSLRRLKARMDELRDTGDAVSPHLRRAILDATPATEHLQASIRELEREMKAGTITTAVYDRTFKHLSRELRQAQGRIWGGRNATGRFNNAMQQASFGVQDFVQVIGQTGLSGALRASANNMAQVAAVVSNTWGPAIGIAATGASILIATLLEAEDATDQFREAIERAADAIDRIRSIRELQFEVQDIIAADDIDDAVRKVDGLRKKLRMATAMRDEMKEGPDTRSAVAAAARMADKRVFAGGPGTFRPNLGPEGRLGMARSMEARGFMPPGTVERLERLAKLSREALPGEEAGFDIAMQSIEQEMIKTLRELNDGAQLTFTDVQDILASAGRTEQLEKFNEEISDISEKIKKFGEEATDSELALAALMKAFGESRLAARKAEMEMKKETKTPKTKSETHAISDLIAAGRSIQQNAFSIEDRQTQLLQEVAQNTEQIAENTGAAAETASETNEKMQDIPMSLEEAIDRGIKLARDPQRTKMFPNVRGARTMEDVATTVLGSEQVRGKPQLKEAMEGTDRLQAVKRINQLQTLLREGGGEKLENLLGPEATEKQKEAARIMEQYLDVMKAGLLDAKTDIKSFSETFKMLDTIFATDEKGQDVVSGATAREVQERDERRRRDREREQALTKSRFEAMQKALSLAPDTPIADAQDALAQLPFPVDVSDAGEMINQLTGEPLTPAQVAQVEDVMRRASEGRETRMGLRQRTVERNERARAGRVNRGTGRAFDQITPMDRRRADAQGRTAISVAEERLAREAAAAGAPQSPMSPRDFVREQIKSGEFRRVHDATGQAMADAITQAPGLIGGAVGALGDAATAARSFFAKPEVPPNLGAATEFMTPQQVRGLGESVAPRMGDFDRPGGEGALMTPATVGVPGQAFFSVPAENLKENTAEIKTQTAILQNMLNITQTMAEGFKTGSNKVQNAEAKFGG